ncbi:MAG: hypothetical protein ABSC63_10290 [Candidatus Binataceae bacterium]
MAALILTWVFLGYDIYNRHYSAPITQVSAFNNPDYVGKTPSKQIWRKEIVPLDGYYYVNCEFYDVTFEYEGTTPIRFDNNHIYGFDLKTNNPAISNWNVFLKAAGGINPNVHLVLPPGTRTDVPFEPAR